MNKINVVFDNRHPEDKERLIAEFQRQGITDYKFHDATVFSHSVVSSINHSHKKIVREAKELGLESVTIAEQDLLFPSVHSWEHYLNNKPSSYHIYLGGTYILPVSNNIICGFHLYTVHESFYDKYLSVDDDLHIDSAISDLKGDFHFCYPLAALQRSGFSANNGCVCNYNHVLQVKDIYMTLDDAGDLDEAMNTKPF